MKAQDILIKARALLDNPAHWTKDVFVKRDDDTPTYVGDPTGCKFCLAGAIITVANLNKNEIDTAITFDDAEVQLAFQTLNIYLNGTFNAIVYNDLEDTKHEDILWVLDKAIKFGEKK